MAAQVAMMAPIVVHHGFAAPAGGSGSPARSQQAGSSSGSPSSTEQAALKRATSLLSLMLSAPRDEACGSPGQLAAMEGDYSEDEDCFTDDEDEQQGDGLSPAIEICIRDERHYRAMLQARAVVNSRLCAAGAAYPQQQHQQQQYHQQQAAPQAARY